MKYKVRDLSNGTPVYPTEWNRPTIVYLDNCPDSKNKTNREYLQVVEDKTEDMTLSDNILCFICKTIGEKFLIKGMM